MPSCAHASRPLERPGKLIAVPFPASTVFQRKRENPGGMIYEALVPGVLRSTRDYFKTQLPKHGFTLGEGDSEEHEAETDFSGNGFEGHLKLNDTEACVGVVRLEIALR